MSPSGKALDFDSSIRQFKSGHPSQHNGGAMLPLCVGWDGAAAWTRPPSRTRLGKSSNLAASPIKRTLFSTFFDSKVFRNFIDAFRAFRVCRQIRTGETVESLQNCGIIDT